MAGHTALVVVDMLNTYEHEDAEKLTANARVMKARWRTSTRRFPTPRWR
jgi:hypothetical protein